MHWRLLLPTAVVALGGSLGWLTASGRLGAAFAQVQQAHAVPAAGTQLPRPDPAFTGNIREGYKDSTPNYPLPVKAPKGSPNVLVILLDDVTKVGALIDASVTSGSNRIAGLTFEAKDPEPARLEALRAAVAKAKSEAEAVATAMGVTLGMAIEVQTSADYGYPPPTPMYRTMEMAGQAAAPTPIEASEQVLRASVTIRYRLLAR